MTALADHEAPPAPGSRPLPLPGILVVVWLSSLANVTFNLGIYFVTTSAFEFSKAQNLLLALVIGAAYIPGALFVGPMIRRAIAARPGVTTRLALGAIMAAVALATVAPWLARAPWSVWPAGAIFSAASGAMWPVIHSYLSGGRRGAVLRRASAMFNVTWASTTFVSMWLIAPLMDEHPLWALAGAGALQAAVILGLLWLPSEPAKALPDEHAPHPPIYRDLLAACRWLLPASYVLCYCLAPMLPVLASRHGLDDVWATAASSAWGFCRWLVFILFGVWAGWHGRWWAPIVSGAALLVGFGLTVASWDVPSMIAGLAVFGVGMGGVYAAALYYAMEVGAAEVEAGGTHEALIGVGFMAGPLIGLAAGLPLPGIGARPTEVTIGLASLVALLTTAAIVRTIRARRA